MTHLNKSTKAYHLHKLFICQQQLMLLPQPKYIQLHAFHHFTLEQIKRLQHFARKVNIKTLLLFSVMSFGKDFVNLALFKFQFLLSLFKVCSFVQNILFDSYIRLLWGNDAN